MSVSCIGKHGNGSSGTKNIIENRKHYESIVSGFASLAKSDSTHCFGLSHDARLSREEQYVLTSQIRRSAVSIASNIAEEQGRLSAGELRQFLGIARGSNFEVQTQLEIARAFEIWNPKLLDEAEGLSHEVGKTLYALIESTKG